MILVCKPSLLAAFCALALVGILISPAVPSPPTLVGKSVQGAIMAPAAIALLPPTSELRVIIGGQLYRTFDLTAHGAGPAAGPGSLPLRR